MKDKEIIEEMAKEICNVCYERQGLKTRWCEIYERKDCSAFDDAEIFYNAGYRKITDSVVLSREEYKRLLDNAIRVDMEYLDHERLKARKETAEKILKDLTSVIHDNRQYGNDFVVVYVSDIQELAKQFGVEIKE